MFSREKARKKMEDWRILCSTLMIIMMVIEGGEAQLSENFYSSSCPRLERIVQQAVKKKHDQTFVTAPATLRLFFHDCLVLGCDASVMIFSPNGDAEKDSDDDLSLAGDGFDTVIKAKQAVEANCPGVVSCADILALAAREAVVLTGGPSFSVELGRRDGLRSKKSDVTKHLPEPDHKFNELLNLFAKNGLNQTDLVALSGAHTIGAAHCSKFSKRIYNYSQFSPIDPTLDPLYALQLQQQCPPGVNPNIVAFLDPLSSNTFDNTYYKNLFVGRGLLTSDQELFTNLASRPTVIDFANNPGNFNAAFVTAMRKLGRVGVKTGNQGEIRRNCAAFNS
ncbi:peroxidase 55-like [Chenopodium quinoa]|uniref:Peroxidase n=1 Tax=Chenopodium quinoa TaxID=63459 RepID=A0A803KWN3_CHEQI|nr:peroxidase 55-like [Chenopodium quinoa]